MSDVLIKERNIYQIVRLHPSYNCNMKLLDMTSEQNSSYDYKKFQSGPNNPHQLNPGFPNRKPTEGEIDQFIELLKNSQSADNQNDDKLINAKEIHNQYGDSDLRSQITLCHSESDGRLKSPCKSNSRVTLNDDGILIKTIHVQSSERFEQEYKDDLKDHISPQESKDYLRKTTFWNKKSALRVTISRDQEKNQNYNSGFDVDNRLISEEMMYSKKLMERQSYSRDFRRSPHITENFVDEFCDSSSYIKCPNKPHPTGSDIRTSPTPPMYAQRSSYSGDAPNQDGSPYFYEKNKLSSGRDESPDRINFPYGRDKLSRQPQISRSPSPYRKRRNPGDNDFYNTPGVPVISDYDIRIHSPEMKGRRNEDLQDKRKYPFTIPSPPPPPILSISKKKKPKTKSDQELSKINKSSTNPLSTLLADRNVSISTLLEAAIGSTGEKRSSTDLDPSTKAEILSSCEEKIGQLYRHRVSGPGCFIPDPVSRQFSLNVNSSILVHHYPKLEFNSRTINNIWHCPGIVEPVPQINEIISKTGHEDNRKLSIHSRYSTSTKSKGTCGIKGSDKVSDYIGTGDNLNCHVLHPEKPDSIQFGNTVSNTSVYKSSASLECVNEPPSGYINSTDQWQQYGNDDGRSQYNTTVTSCALYPQPPSSEYDPNNWSNSGAYNTFGYSQPQFENQQLVQYQPMGPYSSYGNNTNYLVGQNENSPFAADEFGQFPSDQWYPSNEPNIQFQGTVQYPLKQRSNLGGNDSKNYHSKNSLKFVNPNLHVISLTENKATHATLPSNEKMNRNEGQQMLHLTSCDDNKNKFMQRSTKHLEISELIEKSEEDLEMSKILLQNENIRRLQLNDSVMYNIIVDLENGQKTYSYDYVMLHRMLWRKDNNKCKIYISKAVEMSILSLFHESFHDLNNFKLIDLAKRYLTIIPRIHEKLKYISRLCPLCDKAENYQRLGGHSSKRRSRSPRNKGPLPHVSRKSRSRSPSKKRQLHHTSSPSTITSSKNICIPTNYSRPSDSKDVVDPYIGNKSFKSHLQRHENILKRRPGSRSRERRDESRRKSKYRRSSSFDKYRTESSSPTEGSVSCNQGDRIPKNKSRSSESPTVEAIADDLKLPSKNIEIINLVEEIDETEEDHWISYDSVGPDSEEETIDKNICNKTKKILDSKKDKRRIMKSKKQNASKYDTRKIDVNKTEGPIENKGLSKKLDSDKHAVRRSNNYKLMHSIPTSKAAGKKGQENKSQIKTKDRCVDGQESVSILECEPKSNNIQKQDQKVEKGNVKILKEETKQKEEQNRKSIEVDSHQKKEISKENAPQQENKSEKENVKKQKEDNEETAHNENQKSVFETSSNLMGNSCSAPKQLNKPEKEWAKSEKKDKEGSTKIEEQKNAVKTESNITKDCSSSLKQENKSKIENVKKLKEETKQKKQEETKQKEEQNENTVEVDRNQKKDSSNAPHQENKPVKEILKKQKEIKEETEPKEVQNLRNVEENSLLKKEIFAQKQESEAEDTTKNSYEVPHKEESNILQSSSNEKEEPNVNQISNKEENKPVVKLDFKARVRNIQLESNELKYIIDCIEKKKKENVDSCYLIKGGMLCKKCLIGDKSEVRIVAINELINNLVFAVHTMSTNHASVQKTLMLFNKHFVPITDMDKVVEEVVKGCQICN